MSEVKQCLETNVLESNRTGGFRNAFVEDTTSELEVFSALKVEFDVDEERAGRVIGGTIKS